MVAAKHLNNDILSLLKWSDCCTVDHNIIFYILSFFIEYLT